MRGKAEAIEQKRVPEGRVRGRSAAGRGRSTGPTWWRAARNGGFFREIPVRFTIRGHAGDVYTTPSSPDSRWLASGGWDKTVRLYDAGTGEPCATLPHPGVVHDLAYGPDGRCLTICGRGRPFACGRSTAGRARCSAGTPTRSSRPPFTPTAGAAGRDGAVWLWDLVRGEDVARLQGHTSFVWSLAFSPDGATLASGSGDFTVRLWDTAPLRTRYQARREAEALRPDAERLVESLWRQKPSPAGVVDALRADRVLSEPLRQAALRAVLRRAQPPGPAAGEPPAPPSRRG